ncbi:response regulator [Wukongibacter sp. M2B1]|uniref:response regulator n=1 Tax=Wukongibacter sp. M2B1 TaxID=3088895 RepID=UPI003D78B3B7
MIKAVFIDDTMEYLQCIQEYMGDYFKEKGISFKTYLMKDKNDDIRIENEIVKEQPDLIFCDMAMPHCDGSTLIKRITKIYKPTTILISAVEKINIHKDEFDYILRKQMDLDILKEAINLIIRSFELQEELTIDEILSIEFPYLKYTERMYLREIVRKFKDVENPKKVKVSDISRATNKEVHTTIDRINRFIKKMFKEKIDRDLFLFELLKVVYKRGFPNDKRNSE